jgi:NMD protein affecting ribosome stability and mRNA decay
MSNAKKQLRFIKEKYAKILFLKELKNCPHCKAECDRVIIEIKNGTEIELCPNCGIKSDKGSSFYDQALNNLFDFSNNIKVLKKEEIYDCLRQILGFVPTELIKNPNISVSLTDIQTDLKILFNSIKALEKE